MKKLTESRKADRETMAQLVEALAKRYGWQHYRCEYTAARGDARVHVIGQRGLACSIEFERQSAQKDNYCMPWHFDVKPSNYDPRAYMSAAFGRAQGGSVNSHHRRKCTTFADGIEELLEKLEAGMIMAESGAAFMPPAAYIMKNCTTQWPDKWEYCFYTADWQALPRDIMTPEQALERMAKEGLQSVSPIEMHQNTLGVRHG